MILRNTAGQPILIGPLELIADGAAVTSGASISTRIAGSTAAGAGTLAHVSGGIWEYIPTQTETDTTVLGLILSGTSARSIGLSVPTTRFPAQTAGVLPAIAAGASGGLPTGDASGRVLLQPVTHTSAVIPTVSTVTNAVTAGTVSDKTGYSLTQSFPTNFATLAIDANGRTQVQVGTSAGQINAASGVVPANVTQFGGSAGTFAGGRPEVNATHWGGTAVASANVRANVVQIAGQTASASAGVTFPASIGTSTLDASGVWSHATRVLTAGTNIVLAKGTGVTGFNDIDAAAVWSHVTRTLTSSGSGGATAQEVWEYATRTLTGSVTVGTNNDKTGYSLTTAPPTAAQIVTATLDGVVEGTTTVVQSLRLANAVLGGKASGLDTDTAVFRDLADSKARVTATVDADGNRTAITRDLT